MKHAIQLATIVLVLALSIGSVSATSSAQDRAGEAYTVQAGDWLSKLAQEHYGDPLAYSIIVEATNAKAVEDGGFTLIDNPDLILAGQKVWIPALLPLASITLPDDSECLFAGEGATLAFDGQRLNYTCGPEGTVGLLGDPQLDGDILTVEKVTLGHNDSGFFIQESDTVSMQIVEAVLTDGADCLFAGKGATLAFDGQRLNYTCGPEVTAGLLGDFRLVGDSMIANKAAIGHTDSGFVLEGSSPATVNSVRGEAVSETVGTSQAAGGPQATVIELAEGKQCTFAGGGAAVAFDGKRLNYNCGTQGEDQVGLIGDVLVQNGNLVAEKAIIGHKNDGCYLKESKDISGPAQVVALADGAECLTAGQGATLAFDGKRMNFDCGVQNDDQVGLLGDLSSQDGVFQAEKALIGHDDSDFSVRESEMVPATLISQQEPDR